MYCPDAIFKLISDMQATCCDKMAQAISNEKLNQCSIISILIMNWIINHLERKSSNVQGRKKKWLLPYALY